MVGGSAKGQAGTKSIIELVKEATGASEDDVKQSLEEHGGDVNATVNALLDGGIFSSVVTKKTKKKQKEDERKLIQQREAAAAAASKAQNATRRQSTGGHRDRGGRPREAPYSARGGRGSQLRAQPAASEINDSDAAPEQASAQTIASNTPDIADTSLTPQVLPQYPQEQPQQQQQRLPVVAAPTKPWGAPMEGSMSMAERLRQPPPPPPLQQQPQHPKPEARPEPVASDLTAPSPQPSDSQHSLSNGVSMMQPQRPSGLQQLDESHHQTQQQQDLQTTVEQQHSGYSMPLLKQQQPQDLHLQQEHSLEQQLQLHQEQQQKASLEHSIAGQAQEEMSRLDLGAPLRNISAGLESADHPHVVWAAAEGTQPSQHSTVSHGATIGGAANGDQADSAAMSSSLLGTQSGGGLLSDPAIVSHSLTPGESQTQLSQGDTSERMQLQFGQFDLGNSHGFASSLPPQQQHEPPMTSAFTHQPYNAHSAISGTERQSRNDSGPGSQLLPVTTSDIETHRYTGPAAPVPSNSIGQQGQELQPGTGNLQSAQPPRRPSQHLDHKYLNAQQPASVHHHRDSSTPEGSSLRTFNHTQQSVQTQGQQSRPPQQLKRQQHQQQQQHYPPQQQSYPGSSMYGSGHNQHYGQQYSHAFAQPTPAYEVFGDSAGLCGSDSVQRHMPFATGYGHGNVSSQGAPAGKSVHSQTSSYAPPGEKAQPQEESGSMAPAPMAVGGMGSDVSASNRGRLSSHGLQAYDSGIGPGMGMGAYGYSSGGNVPPAHYGGGGYGGSGNAYSSGKSGASYDMMHHHNAAYPYGNSFSNQPVTGYSQPLGAYPPTIQPGGYGSANLRAEQESQSQQYQGHPGPGARYGNKDRREDAYQQESNPFPGANPSYDSQGYGNYGNAQYNQQGQPHWQTGGGGGFSNSGYNPYEYPPQGGNK